MQVTVRLSCINMPGMSGLELLPKAKRYAQRHGKSLSAVIEQALRDLAEDEGPSFAERWRGAFALADRDDERYRALARKYR